MAGGKLDSTFHKSQPSYTRPDLCRHLMTGIGAYFYITWGIWLRHCLNRRQDEFTLKWPSIFFSVPECVRSANRNGVVKNAPTNKIE